MATDKNKSDDYRDMSFDIDSSYILYGLGAVLGVYTVLYFGLEVILSLSPLTKSFMLSVGSAAFFLIAGYLETERVSNIFYGFSGVSYLVFTGYTLLRFEFSSELTFLFLGGSSALFIFLGYKVSDGGLSFEHSDYRKAIAGLTALAALLLVFDVLGAQPDHEIDLQDSVDLENGENVVGTYTISNSFLLPRDADPKSYSSCIYSQGEQWEASFSSVEWQEDSPKMIYSGDSVVGNLTARVPQMEPRHEEEKEVANISGSFEVEKRDECPESLEGKKVVVAESSGYD